MPCRLKKCEAYSLQKTCRVEICLNYSQFVQNYKKKLIFLEELESIGKENLFPSPSKLSVSHTDYSFLLSTISSSTILPSNNILFSAGSTQFLPHEMKIQMYHYCSSYEKNKKMNWIDSSNASLLHFFFILVQLLLCLLKYDNSQQ